MLDGQRRVDGCWLVVVPPHPFLGTQVASVDIVGVEINRAPAKTLDEGPDDRRLARPGAPPHADEDRHQLTRFGAWRHRDRSTTIAVTCIPRIVRHALNPVPPSFARELARGCAS